MYISLLRGPWKADRQDERRCDAAGSRSENCGAEASPRSLGHGHDARKASMRGGNLSLLHHSPVAHIRLSEHWGAARTSQILPTRTRPRQPASHEKHEWHTLICLLAFLRGAAPASSMAGDQTRNEHMCRWTRETKKSQMRTSSAQRRSQNGPRHFAQGERAGTRDEGGEVRRGVGVAQMPSDYSPAAFFSTLPSIRQIGNTGLAEKKANFSPFSDDASAPAWAYSPESPARRPSARPPSPAQPTGKSIWNRIEHRFALCSFSAREPHPLTRQDGDCGCPLRLADPLTVAPRARSEIGGKGSVVGSPGAGNMHPALRALGRANWPARFHGLPQKEG
jgi:hypothetical protein